MLITDFIHSETLLTLSVGLLGLLVGSFLNVVIYRLPKMMALDWEAQARSVLGIADPVDKEAFNLVLPHSKCTQCDHEIKPWENIPIVSWLLLRGRCSSCKTSISFQYPLVEAVTALLSIAISIHYGATWEALAMLALTWLLIAMSAIDIKHHLLPDSLTLTLLWLGLIANSFGMFTSLNDAVLGAVAGYGTLWCVLWFFKLVTGKDGMGYGDLKLFAAIGAWGGWQALPLTIVLSSVVGVILSVAVLAAQGKSMKQAIPFGPYLAIAGWIALIYGQQINQLYFRLAGMA